MLNRTTLAEIIHDYLAEQRALGYQCEKKQRMLARLATLSCAKGYTGPVLEKVVVQHWTHKRQHETETNRRHRCSAVRGLATYMIRLGYAAYLFPSIPASAWMSTFQPYIFSDREIAALFVQIERCAPSITSPCRHLVLPVIFQLLYGSGLRISEVLSLHKDAVDLEDGVLYLTHTKFGKERLVPVHPAVHQRCRVYAIQMERYPVWRKTRYFFPAPHGGKYDESTLYAYFRRFLWAAGISHGGRGHGPRLHDMRHTYAVHCLRKWVCAGHDLTTAMPYLSAYLGHAGIRGTQHYLRLTAELYPNLVRQVEQAFDWVVPEVKVE